MVTAPLRSMFVIDSANRLMRSRKRESIQRSVVKNGNRGTLDVRYSRFTA